MTDNVVDQIIDGPGGDVVVTVVRRDDRFVVFNADDLWLGTFTNLEAAKYLALHEIHRHSRRQLRAAHITEEMLARNGWKSK